MLLTLNPPMHNSFSRAHEYTSSPISSAPPRYHSPPKHVENSLIRSPDRGSMNSSHRGLPPPSSLTLPPPPERGPTSNHVGSTNSINPISQSAQLPPAPQSQWQSGSTDESMRNWLQARTEEDRRKQEEERTKQETLRLDQRKIEQDMLRESLQGGVPPHMIPLIFAGIGGGNLPSQSLELMQHYLSQVQPSPLQPASQSARPQMSPDVRRNDRMIPTNPYSNQAPLASNVPPPAPSQGFGRGQPNSSHPGPTSVSRPAQESSGFSRLTSGEMQIQPPAPGAQYSMHALQQAPRAQPETAHQPPPINSSPIYFHHYVPPNQQSGGSGQPSTPSTKNESPFSQHAPSHLRSEYQNSPKKRKAQGSHQPAPPPSTSPSYSQTSSTGTPPGSRRNTVATNASASGSAAGPASGDASHSRQRSNTSSRGGDDRGQQGRSQAEMSRGHGSSPGLNGPRSHQHPASSHGATNAPPPGHRNDERHERSERYERSDRNESSARSQHSVQMMYNNQSDRHPMDHDRERIPSRD